MKVPRVESVTTEPCSVPATLGAGVRVLHWRMAMAGPVWRFMKDREGTCDACLRRCKGMYVEGEVADNELRAVRAVCPACAENVNGLVVSGEAGGRVAAPAYAHNAGS